MEFKNRRNIIKTILLAPIVTSLGIIGCGGSSSGTTSESSTVSSTDEVNTGNTENNESESTVTSSNWQSGTTDLITVDYPADSIFETSNTCVVALTQATTEGPCYFADDTGEDISLGLSGLPMQLCLRLVDINCEPLENYTIEVWHCDTEGIYSGDTSSSSDSSSFAGDFCTGRDSLAEQSTWYRGMLTSNSNGRVNFKSSFPGWYSGRTLHIHFSVKDSSGNSEIISQFCFTDAFAKEICMTHELYSSRGEQDTTLASNSDTVFPSDGIEDYQLSTEQNSDGTLLAYHTIQIY